MKHSQSHWGHPPASLFVLVTLATVLMYFVALGVSIPDSNPYTILAVASASLFCFIPLLLFALLTIIDEFHKAIMDWKEREHRYRTRQADREHYYAHRRRMRELAEKRYRHKYRFPVYRHHPRNVRVQRRPKDSDMTNYGC